MKVWIFLVLVLFFACERVDELSPAKSLRERSTSKPVSPSKENSLCGEECKEHSREQKFIFPKVDFIASSQTHSFFLSDGLLYGWGDNEFQQLWQSSHSYWDEPQLAPPQLQQLHLKKLFLGKNFTFALNAEGDLFSWGDNTFGQLANKSPADYQRLDLPAIKKVAVGGSHVLAVTESGVVYSWGANWVGQLGRTTEQSLDVSQNEQYISASATPGKVSHLDQIQLVAAGQGHSLALSKQGRVYGWGLSTFGALGADAIVHLVRIPTALSADSIIDAEVVEIPTLIGLIEDVEQLAAGAAHSLALIAGRVYSWGLNDQGQLGRASRNAKKYTVYHLQDNGEVKVKLLEVDIDPKPQVIEELTNIVAISSRGNSSFALDATGQLYFWGGNFSRPQGMPLYQIWQIDQLNGVKDIAAAGNASLLLLNEEDHPFYWGVFRSLQALNVAQVSSKNEQSSREAAGARQPAHGRTLKAVNKSQKKTEALVNEEARQTPVNDKLILPH